MLRIAPDGTVATIVGTGDPDYNGDVRPRDPAPKWLPKAGTQVNVNGPRGLVTNLAGQLLVAEPDNGLVRRWDPGQGGTVTIVAGKTKNSDTADQPVVRRGRVGAPTRPASSIRTP